MWFQYVFIGAKLHCRFETLVPVSDVDQLVLLVLLVNILFQSTSRSLIFLVHWPIPLVRRGLRSSGLVLA